MVITPILRGMFGISIDAQKKTITVNPQLPAGWNHSEVLHLSLPGAAAPADLFFDRHGSHIDVSANLPPSSDWKLRSDLARATYGTVGFDEASAHSGQNAAQNSTRKGLRIPQPALEVDESMLDMDPLLSANSAVQSVPPTPGARTSRFRIVRAEYGKRQIVLEAEGLAGTTGYANLIRHGAFIPKVQADPPTIAGTDEATAEVSIALDAEQNSSVPVLLHLHFPPGEGWKTVTVTLTW